MGQRTLLTRSGRRDGSLVGAPSPPSLEKRRCAAMAKTEQANKSQGKKSKGKSKSQTKGDESTQPTRGRSSTGVTAAGQAVPLARKEYERQMRVLHGELVAMQEWIKATGAKICIVFEGRDTAGKGGAIKRITERVSPRVFRVVALPAPTARERSQMYVQRYIPHLPAAGEVVIFDRSWYNRAGVEPVMGFCTPEESQRFLAMVPATEKAMVDSGILLLKYWLEVSPEEQTRRLESRVHDPRKVWKLSDLDLKSYSRWYDYSRARDAMFAATDTAWAPWWVAHSDDKKRARLNIISHLLSQVPYEPLARREIELPKRQRPDGYVEPRMPLRYIPTPF
jgi:polyphosphate kinase